MESITRYNQLSSNSHLFGWSCLKDHSKRLCFSSSSVPSWSMEYHWLCCCNNWV